MMGAPVDEQWGGLGADQLMYALVCEELGRASGAVGLSYAAHVSLAKLDASEICREVTEEAVQVHGGYGYTTDFAPQRFYRDAKLMEIGEGTSEIQRLVLRRELGL